MLSRKTWTGSSSFDADPMTWKIKEEDYWFGSFLCFDFNSNRAALRSSVLQEISVSSVAARLVPGWPLNRAEFFLVRIWSKLLKIRVVGINLSEWDSEDSL
jgi:hypothetical protein